MECRKCSGLMVEEFVSDLLEEAYVWHCLNCGAITDATIERNQKLAVPEKHLAYY